LGQERTMDGGGRQSFDCTLPAMANLENNQPVKSVKAFASELLAWHVHGGS
jgi:hypothetical protein